GTGRVRVEAYFLSLAREPAKTSPLPLMLTGGVVRLPPAEELLSCGIDLVGMGTALALDPDLPKRWHRDAGAEIVLSPVRIEDKAVASAASTARVRQQLRHRLARPSTPTTGP
ncbi:HisA/HisF-related TIM barrel protein, partial [Nocardia sp. NPDC019302]|uniref:HisA/HisF-related TIM barrel protein n=1 Tax=Nocardia sp. NPDC019302 TaxID=3154592 RepID=UPI0033F3C7E2